LLPEFDPLVLEPDPLPRPPLLVPDDELPELLLPLPPSSPSPPESRGPPLAQPTT
jgi:hypothetical protein